MIYMDNAATTRVKDEVVQAMLPYFTQVYGNPSSVHAYGRAARKAVESARRSAAEYLGCQARELYFTSGGSEADSWALLSSAKTAKGRKTLITSQIEHKAVLNAARQLESEGFTVKYLPVDAKGVIHPEELEKRIDDDTFLVSVMAVNNEVGSVQDIAALSRIARSHGALFHTDAVQAMDLFNGRLGAGDIDLLSLSGHKLHAPKGVGALYIRDGLDVHSLISGGSQERGKRGGTENVTGIVGLGKAFELLAQNREEYIAQKRTLIKRLEDGILNGIDGTSVNGPCAEERACGILNVAFDGVDGEALLFNLDLKGIAVSAGSACTAGSVDISHVLLAMGLKRQKAHASIRFSVSDENTVSEVDEVLTTLGDIIHRIRK